VDTEDGLERNVTIIGPSAEGDKDELRVRFADDQVMNAMHTLAGICADACMPHTRARARTHTRARARARAL
jgi:hypothetical protein